LFNIKLTLASVAPFSHIFGAIITAGFAGRFGRRPSMVAFSLLQVISWTVLALSDGNSDIMIVGRFLQGLTLLTSVVQLYLTEITDTNTRSELKLKVSI